MKTALAITSVESKVIFAEGVLIDFVNRNLSPTEIETSDESFSPAFSTISWASTDMPVYGRLDIISTPQDRGSIDRIILPVNTQFFITCIKESSGICKVEWSLSLS
ncbi:MAG: hypothetical protein ACSLE0_17140 [Chitinophagaceae bacterium]